MKYSHPEKDIIEALINRVTNLEKRINALTNLHNPTVPIYDPLDLPDDLVEAQFFIGTNNKFYIYVGGSAILVGP